MTLELFLSALRRHVAGVEDRAGIKALDVLLAQARDAVFDAGEWTSFVQTAIETENVAAPGFWTAIRLTVGKLDLHSAQLAGRIETALTSGADALESFDAYEGWRTFAEAGGYLAPKMVKALASLRSERAPLWLDLAILAFQGDPAGLGAVVRELAEAGEIEASDLRSRLSPLQNSLGQDHFLAVMTGVARAFPDRAAGAGFGEWLGEKMGTDTLGRGAVDLADALGVVEGTFLAAVEFAFVVRRPKPILALA